MKCRLLAVACVSLAWIGATPLARAQRDARDWGRIALDLQLGFVGEQVAESGPDQDLDMTLAAGARIEKPVSPVFTLGALASTGFWRTDAMEAADVRRNIRVDLDLLFKPRYAWRTGRGHMEIGLLIPVGFTFQADNEDAGLFNSGYGYNVGALLGWQAFPHRRAGVLLEFGWRRHQTWHDPGELIAQELVLDVGFALLM